MYVQFTSCVHGNVYVYFFLIKVDFQPATSLKIDPNTGGIPTRAALFKILFGKKVQMFFFCQLF